MVRARVIETVVVNQGLRFELYAGSGWWRAIYTRTCPVCAGFFETFHAEQLLCGLKGCAVQRRRDLTRERVRRHRQRHTRNAE